MVLKLYGNLRSTCTQRVRVVLEELALRYEFVVVDFAKGEHKAPAFTAVQPFGQVPYLDDDGFKLYESRAIGRYLALKYGGIGKLIPDPADVQKTAVFEQGASIELCNFDRFTAALGFENVAKPMLGLQTDHALVEQLKGLLAAKLESYEVLLSRQKYIGGDELSLVDLFHLPTGALLKIQNIDFLESDKYPNTKKWWAEISSRAAWQKVSARA